MLFFQSSFGKHIPDPPIKETSMFERKNMKSNIKEASRRGKTHTTNVNQEPPKKKKVKIEVNKIINPSDFEERKITY